jgi:methionine-gamma-lyase
MSQPRRRRRPHPGRSTRDRRSIRHRRRLRCPSTRPRRSPSRTRTRARRGSPATEDGYIYTRLGNPTIAGPRGLRRRIWRAATAAWRPPPAWPPSCAVYVALLGQGRPRRLVAARSTARAGSCSSSMFSRFGVESTFVHTETPRRSRRRCGRRRGSSTSRRRRIRPWRSRIWPARPRSAHAARRAPLRRQHLLQPRACSGRSSTAADIVLHSMTKFLNGHADVVAGSWWRRNEATFAKLRPVS